VVAALLALAGCDDGSPKPVVVGSKNFTEQRILGEVLAQTIEAAGIPVVRKLDLGGTFVCDTAIRAGQLDTYVEYGGTALTAILKERPMADPAAVLAHVRAGYAAARIVWLQPLGFDDTFALVVRPDAGVRTISESIAAARGWRAGFGYEFAQRPDGLPALTQVYGLSFADVKTMDLGLLYRALDERQVDVVAGNATDGLIAARGLVTLVDDHHAFPPYEAVPVVREDALARWPALRGALDGLAGRLDANAMRRLNLAVDGEHRAPADVVRAWREAR
jgi:osmoprotectant transport system substrate-binding protein